MLACMYMNKHIEYNYICMDACMYVYGHILCDCLHVGMYIADMRVSLGRHV